mmetsp:Transcript_16846/g.38844  ORF Transcript_16846/g.38844 Transcript_16846/m.38844 type:complete len:218 (+) Transcript_16846:3534-4187(+)
MKNSYLCTFLKALLILVLFGQAACENRLLPSSDPREKLTDELIASVKVSSNSTEDNKKVVEDTQKVLRDIRAGTRNVNKMIQIDVGGNNERDFPILLLSMMLSDSTELSEVLIDIGADVNAGFSRLLSEGRLYFTGSLVAVGKYTMSLLYAVPLFCVSPGVRIENLAEKVELLIAKGARVDPDLLEHHILVSDLIDDSEGTWDADTRRKLLAIFEER